MLVVTLVCDDCDREYTGISHKRFVLKRYLEQAEKAGWSVRSSTKHLCPLCLHSLASGHRVNTLVGVCTVPGCTRS